MAFIASANTVTLTAKLTPYGRQQLLANTNSVISQFSLGDSDANYRSTDMLSTGEVPSTSGDLGLDNTLPNSVTTGVSIRHKILVNTKGAIMKPVEANSNQINSVEKLVGTQTLDESEVTAFVIDRTNSANPLINLFSTFGLPITDKQKTLYADITDAFGGFSNTALAHLNQDKALVISIPSTEYGEMVDGRTLGISIVTSSAGTFTIYSTYQKSLTALNVQDTKTAEISPKASTIGSNIVFLFSDEIQPPNNNGSKSWATGFGEIKPFSVAQKELFNMIENTATSIVADKTVGVAYLDKGFIVITDPTIVDGYIDGDGITIGYDSLVHEVSQDITCIVNRGEFSVSTNPTFSSGDVIRLSEVGLHDATGNLMAVAKTSQHIPIGANQFLALGIKITV